MKINLLDEDKPDFVSLSADKKKLLIKPQKDTESHIGTFNFTIIRLGFPSKVTVTVQETVETVIEPDPVPVVNCTLQSTAPSPLGLQKCKLNG